MTATFNTARVQPTDMAATAGNAMLIRTLP